MVAINTDVVVLVDNSDRINVSNTQILGTRLGSLDRDGRSVTFNITPSNVEELLRNATFSLMSLNLFNTTVNVTLHNYVNVYAFDPTINLVIPYAVCLSVGLILIIIGAVALEKNGVSASDGFIQTLCTTQASDSFRKIAQTGARGNNEHLPKEVLGMKIQYGAIGVHHGPTEAGEAGEEDEIELDVHSKHEGLIGFGQPGIDHFVPFSWLMQSLGLCWSGVYLSIHGTLSFVLVSSTLHQSLRLHRKAAP